MSSSLPKYVIIAGAGLSAIVMWLVRPDPACDITQVDSRLARLAEPFAEVYVDYLWDGGTIAIRLTDCDGRIEWFVFPVNREGGERYDRLFVGSFDADSPEAVEVTSPEHSKRRLVSILRRYASNTRFGDIALWCLTQRPSDLARLCFHGFCGDYGPYYE